MPVRPRQRFPPRGALRRASPRRTQSPPAASTAPTGTRWRPPTARSRRVLRHRGARRAAPTRCTGGGGRIARGRRGRRRARRAAPPVPHRLRRDLARAAGARAWSARTSRPPRWRRRARSPGAARSTSSSSRPTPTKLPVRAAQPLRPRLRDRRRDLLDRGPARVDASAAAALRGGGKLLLVDIHPMYEMVESTKPLRVRLPVRERRRRARSTARLVRGRRPHVAATASV